MKVILFIITVYLQSSILHGQIWNYPPEALPMNEEYENLKMDSVRTFSVFNKHINEYGELGDYEFKMREHFDSLGRITKIIQENDTITYLNFHNGYWSEGMKEGEKFYQKLKLDEYNNIIYRKV